MKRQMRMILAAGAVLGAGASFAASDVTVPAPNGVGDVVALTNALTQANAGTIGNVLLEPGVYDLKDVAMESASHLALTTTGKWLIGTGSNPSEVVLKGGGEEKGRRVLRLSGANFSQFCNVSNVTITGGWTSDNGGGISGHAHSRAFCCIISNNYATGSNGGGGGGMFKGIARNCYFADNVVSRGISGQHRGGGMWTNTEVALGVGQGAYDCVFTNNWVNQYGGGFYGEGEAKGCTFIDNYAQSSGGGVYNAALIVDCTFVGNKSADGYGGGACAPKAVTNCTFHGNSVQYEGGGGLVTRGDIPVVDCTFENNSCNRDGGGLLCFGGLVSNCTFRCNSSRGDGETGGGLAMLQIFPDKDAQDYTEANKTFKCVDCTFEGNVSKGNGGGMLAPGGVFHCTFVTNSASATGGGLYADRASNCGPVSNCIFRLNRNGTTAGGNALAAASASVGLEAIGCELSANTNAGVAVCSYVTFRESVITNHVSTQWVLRNSNLFGCLIADNRSNFSSGGGVLDYSNESCTNANSIFLRNYQAGNNKITGAKVVINCLYAENTVGTGNYGYIIDPGAEVYNTVFIDNYVGSGTKCDFRKALKSSPYVPKMYNCTYSKLATDVTADEIDSRWTNCVKKTLAELKYSTKDPARPYVPSRRSPLRNKALDDPWILAALGEKDFYDEARVFEDALDIGPAECVEPALGMILLFR